MTAKSKKPLLITAIIIALVGSVWAARTFNAGMAPSPTTGPTEESLFIVRTIPADADILVNGVFAGRSPLPVKIPKAKNSTLTIKHLGFRDYVQVFDGTRAQFQTTIKLEAEPK